MRHYQTIYYTADGDCFMNGVTGSTDKNGNEPYPSEAAGHTFVGVPRLSGDIVGVVVVETFLH